MFDINYDALYTVLATMPYAEMLIYLAVGTMIGLAVGALPGLSTPLGVALGLPLAAALPFYDAIALLVGLYKGGLFGGSITAISFAIPGEAAASAIVADGYSLTRKGQGGKALKTSLYSATLADTTSNMVLIAAAIPLGSLAPLLGPSELTALFFAALTLIIIFSEDAPKGIISAGLGFFIGAIGRDVQTGTVRLDFGIDGLRSGVSLVALLLGLFSIPELIEEAHRLWARREPKAGDMKAINIGEAMRQRLPLREFFGLWRGLAIGTTIGTIFGALPGPGSTLAAYSSYGFAKQFSRRPEQYGKGSLEAIAAAEAGNNAVCGSNLIPLLTFGIPGSAVAGLFGAALIMQGVQPGPRVIVDHPEAIYTLFIIFIIGNAMVFALGRLAIPLFARLAYVPGVLLWPVIAIMVVIGAYAYDVRAFDIWVTVGAGLMGYLFRVFRIPVGPLILAFLVGPLFEESLIRGLVLARGDPFYFFHSPVALAMWAVALASILFLFWGRQRMKKRIPQGIEDD